MKNLLVCVIFCLSLWACGDNQQPTDTQAEILRPIRYATIQLSGGGATQGFSGRAQASTEARLSFKVGGTISKIHVKVGDQVRKGQRIATIDGMDYTITYDQAVANLRSAETQIKSSGSQLKNSQSSYNRIEKLYENNSVSLSEFEQSKAGLEAAQSQYNAAQMQVEASKKQVESARNQVRYTQLTAPFSGVISAVNAEENELVGSGSPIASLTAVTQPEVRVGVPEIYISQIKKGQDVKIQFSVLPDNMFEGKVSEVGFSTAGGATYSVIISIVSPSKEIRPGMAANVYFQFGDTNKENSFVVAPVPSIGGGNEGNFVFLLQADGEAFRAKKQTVTLGKLLGTGFEVKEGLKVGDKVATVGLNSLLDGMRVRLADN